MPRRTLLAGLLVTGLIVCALVWVMPRLITPSALVALPRRTITIDARPLSVVLAVDPARGLMGIDDLGDVDGMLFEHATPSRGRYWMQDVLLPLDIAFFGEDRRLIAQVAMPLCPAAAQASRACPTYGSPASFRWALETATGAFPFPVGAMIDPDPGR